MKRKLKETQVTITLPGSKLTPEDLLQLKKLFPGKHISALEVWERVTKVS